MVKLDYKRWRAELDAAMEKKNAAAITRLHIIRAQIRGKQHRQSARLPYYTISALKLMTPTEAEALAWNGGTKVVALTHEDEAKLLKDAWKDYVITQPVMKMVNPQQKNGESFVQAFRRWLRG